jgi:hypothetical protein
MPLDTRIALSGQPLQVQFRDPIASYNQLAQLTSADTQNQLAQMQMAAAQRTMQEEEGAKNFLSGNPDLSTVENQRRLLAFGKTGLGYAKAIAEQKKAGLEGDKTAAEVLGLNQKNFTAFNPPIRAAAGGIPGITAYVEAMYKDPVLGTLAARVKTKEQALKENIEMYTKDPDQWVTAHSNLEGAQMLDALKMGRENAAEKARIASFPPLPGAVPTGTVNDTRAALNAPGTQTVAEGVQVNPVPTAGNLIPVASNALAPVAGNVNAMVAPTGNEATLQAMAAARKKLNDRLDVLDRMPFSKGKEDETKRIEAQLKDLNTPINLRESGTAITSFGAVTAAAAPTELAKLQKEKLAAVAAGDKTAAAQIDSKIAAMTQLQDHRTEIEKLLAAKAVADKAGDKNASDAIDQQIKVKNQLQDHRSEVEKMLAITADPNASKEAKDAANGRIANLTHVAKDAVPALIQEYEYAQKNNGYKGSLYDFKGAGASKISLTQSAEKSYGTAFGGKIADLDVAKYDAAGRAPELAANANRVLSILNQGDVFVGPAATIKLNLARVLNAAGANNDEKIANTETLISGLGRNTLGMIKGSGLGTAQGFTDKDLQFLERVAGGSIDYNAQTLRTLTDLSHKAATASAETWNKRAKEIPASALGGTGISVEPIVVPARVTKAAAVARPAGVPAEWTLQVDGAGKRAYVSPDGKSFKEVP